MRQPVRYSILVWILTIGITALLFFGIDYTLRIGKTDASIILGVVLAGLFVAALIYAPLWVGIDDGMLLVRRPLRTRRIPLADIAEAYIHMPTMGEKRISASGGWFGYWGWFMEADTGRYFAYYGRSSDCFMVVLKDGRKYLLGCIDQLSILSEIRKYKDTH